MPGSATIFLEQRVLQHSLRIAAYTQPAGSFVGLFLASPAPDSVNAGTEVVGGGYARLTAAFQMASNPSNLAQNTATLEWPPAGAPWGPLGYFAIYDAVSGGNRLYWGPLVDPADGVTPITRNVQTGDIMRIAAGALQVSAY